MNRHLILVDTNAIISSNYKISSPMLLDFLKNGFNKMVISEVCLEEAFKNYSKRQEEAIEKVNTAIKGLGKKGIKHELIYEKIDIQESLDKEVDSLNITLIPRNKADFDFIYKKAMECKKPFKFKNGKESGGIKDNIIWSSYVNYLKEVAHSYDEIIFVTEDSDFVEEKNDTFVLADDLIEDISFLEGELKKLKVVKNLKQLNEQILSPLLPKFDEYNANIQDTIELLLESSIEDNFSEIEAICENKFTEILGQEVTLSVLEWVGGITMPNGIQHTKNEGYIYFTQAFNAQFDYFIHKYDMDGYEDRNYSIVDDDWNDHVMLVEETVRIVVSFEVNVDINSDEDIEIVDFFIHDDVEFD